jgi:hypothetical protein
MNKIIFFTIMLIASFAFAADESATLAGDWDVTIRSVSSSGKANTSHARMTLGSDGLYRFAMVYKGREILSSGTWQQQSDNLIISRKRKTKGELVFVAPEAAFFHEILSINKDRMETKGGNGKSSWNWTFTRSTTAHHLTMPQLPLSGNELASLIQGDWCDASPSKQAGNPAAGTWRFKPNSGFEYSEKTGGKAIGKWWLTDNFLNLGDGTTSSSTLSQKLIAYSTSQDRLLVEDTSGRKSQWYRGGCR